MNKLLLIAVCSAVTLLPRIIPYFASSFLMRLPRFVRKCMMLLPVASLGALIFPLALTDFGPQWYAGLVGGADDPGHRNSPGINDADAADMIEKGAA